MHLFISDSFALLADASKRIMTVVGDTDHETQGFTTIYVKGTCAVHQYSTEPYPGPYRQNHIGAYNQPS